MVRLWQQCKGPSGTLGHLPESGGVLEQSAITMDAIAVMNGTEAELRAAEQARRTRRR
jgi:hypothetical protein